MRHVDVDLQGAGHRRASALLVAAEVERGATESLSYAAGLVVATKEGKVIAANAEPRELAPLEGDEGLAVYAGSVIVDPGRVPAARSASPTPTSGSAASSARSPPGR